MRRDNGTSASCQTIFRSNPAVGYTKISNSLLRDRRLSYEARGLLCELLSRPDDWELTVANIVALGGAGRDKVYRLIREAKALGYIDTPRARRIDGTMLNQRYRVTDDPAALIERTAKEIRIREMRPLTENPEVVVPFPGAPLTEKTEVDKVVDDKQSSPLTEKTEVANHPLPEKPDLVFPTHTNKREDTKEIRIYGATASTTPPGDLFATAPQMAPADPDAPPVTAEKRSDLYSRDFECFWNLYPHKKGKGEAFRRWKKLTLEQKRKAYLALKKQLSELKARMADRRGNFCPMPATWIGQCRFDDEAEKQPTRFEYSSSGIPCL